MSACISRHGEFSSHELGEGREQFRCQLCGVFDEAAALDEVARLRAAIERVLARDVSRELGRRYLREVLGGPPMSGRTFDDPIVDTAMTRVDEALAAAWGAQQRAAVAVERAQALAATLARPAAPSDGAA